MLDTVGVVVDEALLAAWRARIERAARYLGWTESRAVARLHTGGALLALAAPEDQLFVATEVNEWALCAALIEQDPVRWNRLEDALVAAAVAAAENAGNPGADVAPVIDEAAAFARFRRLAASEADPALRALIDAAESRGLMHQGDESELSLGCGTGGRTYPRSALPTAAHVPWDELHNIPTALITGSNGKTTTVRLLAACARAAGRHAGYNCTDGVFLDDEVLAAGDYSGPAGARRVLREPRTEAALIETARGGILRRGIAVSRADVAVVTNVSADHFGEYGIDDLAGLADVKLAVAALVAPDGLLVLNADDLTLQHQARHLVRRFGRRPPLGWFALDADQPALADYRAAGAATCGVRRGRLCLQYRGSEHDLGAVAQMPLSVDGIAAYNVANLGGAALAAMALGISAAHIAHVFARFGGHSQDNPGRLMRFTRGGVQVLIDYAHNPEGLRGFLTVARHLLTGEGRLGLLLGHAGNRLDADIQALAGVAAEFRPDLAVVKENESQLRGRAPGEIPRILHAELLRLGLPESALALKDSEAEAVRFALQWARPGDVLALPVHSAGARAAALEMLEGRSG